MKKMKMNLIALFSGVLVAFLLAGCGTQTGLPANIGTPDQLEQGQVSDPRRDGNNGPIDGIWKRTSTQCMSSGVASGLSDNFIYINNATGYVVQEYMTSPQPAVTMNFQITYSPGMASSSYSGYYSPSTAIGSATSLATGSAILTPNGMNYCKLPNNSDCTGGFNYPLIGAVNFQYSLDNASTLTVSYVSDFVCANRGQSIARYALIPGR